MHFKKWIARAMCISLLLARSINASAEETHLFELHWSRKAGAEQCPDQEKLAREVAARLGRDPFAEEADRRIVASIERQEGRFVFSLEEELLGAETAPLQQDSMAKSCEAIFDYAVLAVAMLIEPEVFSAARGPAPLNKANPCSLCALPSRPRKEPPSPAAPASKISTSEPPSLRMAIFLSGGASYGLLPKLTSTWGLSLNAGGRRFEGSAGMLWAGEALLGEGKYAGIFAFGQTAGWLGACMRVMEGPQISLMGCGHLWLGAITAYVQDVSKVSKSHPGARIWAAASLAPKLQFKLAGPLVLETGFDLMVNTIRSNFTNTVLTNSAPLATSEEPIYLQDLFSIAPFIRLGVTTP